MLKMLYFQNCATPITMLSCKLSCNRSEKSRYLFMLSLCRYNINIAAFTPESVIYFNYILINLSINYLIFCMSIAHNKYNLYGALLTQ